MDGEGGRGPGGYRRHAGFPSHQSHHSKNHGHAREGPSGHHGGGGAAASCEASHGATGRSLPPIQSSISMPLVTGHSMGETGGKQGGGSATTTATCNPRRSAAWATGSPRRGSTGAGRCSGSRAATRASPCQRGWAWGTPAARLRGTRARSLRSTSRSTPRRRSAPPGRAVEAPPPSEAGASSYGHSRRTARNAQHTHQVLSSRSTRPLRRPHARQQPCNTGCCFRTLSLNIRSGRGWAGRWALPSPPRPLTSASWPRARTP